jgi:two-component system, NtrC family, sensor kinase
MGIVVPLPAFNDYRLVLLSIGISILVSYITLDFAGRQTDKDADLRYALFSGGVVAMAGGIWVTHIIGVLAFHLPIAIHYDVIAFAFSLVIAVLTAFIVIYIASLKHPTYYSLILGSLALGAGITLMHHVGIAAMRLSAMPHYHREIFILSILISVLISYIDIQLLSRARSGHFRCLTKLTSACIMGIAMPIVHYTDMAAVYFIPKAVETNLANSIDIATVVTFTICTVMFLALGVLILVYLADSRISARHLILDDERNMLRALIDNIPEFMYVKDDEHRYIVANASLARVMGVENPDHLLGKTDADFYPPDLALSYKEDEVKILRTGQGLYNHEERCVDSQGNEIQILTTKVLLKTRNGKLLGIAGVGLDITVRKKMELALREAELKYRGIFNKAVVGIFQCTPEGRFLSVNPSMAFSFGYASPNEMVETITDISTQFFANTLRGEEFMMIMNKVGGVKNFECEAFCQDGKTIWLTMSTRSIRQNGTIVRFEGVCDDISERMQVREQIMQTQKLEAVGQLAAGIAHEINTPTQFIGNNIRFLKDNFTDLIKLLGSYASLLSAANSDSLTPEILQDTALAAKDADTEYLVREIPKAIDLSLDGIDRIATIVGAMKEFSHPGTKEKVPLDLNHAIESTIVVSRNEWKYVANLETEFDTTLTPIDCLPGEFSQVILNLIVNAAHAIADAAKQGAPALGKIRVTTRNYIDWVEITIADSGTGIPKEVQGRIFDPFFTTKEIGKGTGQGLSIARSVIVDKHGGTIHFETVMGEGTTFFIRLPRIEKPLSRKATAA